MCSSFATLNVCIGILYFVKKQYDLLILYLYQCNGWIGKFFSICLCACCNVVPLDCASLPV